jgi:transcriptional regulator with XRE-family HTH domain
MSGREKLKKKQGRPKRRKCTTDAKVAVAKKLVDEIRQQTGCSQEELEIRYRLPRSTISNIVTGKRPMSAQTLSLLLNSYVRDKTVPAELRMLAAGIPAKMGVANVVSYETELFNKRAELRRRDFELEESKMRKIFEEKIIEMIRTGNIDILPNAHT